jgi:LysM repeat protein
MNCACRQIRTAFLAIALTVGLLAAAGSPPLNAAESSESPFGGSSINLQNVSTPLVPSESGTEVSAAVTELTRQLDELTKRLEEFLKTLEGLRNSIPSTQTASTPQEQAVQAPQTPAPAAAPGTYTVVRGDSLWRIASRFLGTGTRYWDLVEANKDRYPSLAKNPDLIHPGWVLTIPGVNSPATSGPAQGPRTTTPGPATAGSFTPNPNIPAPASDARGGPALLAWLQRAGLTGETLRTAWAIGMAESGGNPRAFNGNAGTGDRSYGLFQINMLGNLGPARLRQYNLNSNEDLFDPEVNIRVMIHMSRNCTNWQPWSVFNRGTYRQWLSRCPL